MKNKKSFLRFFLLGSVELVGNGFTIDFYDNIGTNILTVCGQKVSLEANYISTKGINSSGESNTLYEPSSIITLTVDGNQVNQTGNTVIFAENGLKKLENIDFLDEITSNGGTINILARNISKDQNLPEIAKIVVIFSQLGVPLALYGGESVSWDIPDDLPRTTKLIIDGKSLYIHRANYVLLDSKLLK